MGISGLTTYVSRNFRGWKKITLNRDCSLVIDANALSYHIAGKCDKQWWIHGGDYVQYERFLSEYLDSLLENISHPLHFVFDGIDASGDKEDTLISRKQGRLRNTIQCVEAEVEAARAGRRSHDRRLLLPPLVSEVFLSIIRSYEDKGFIRVHVADGEADGVAVALANDMKCYLVGNDSDYFIYQIQEGFIPIDKLSLTRRGKVECSVFKQHIFADEIGINPDRIIAIPALAGNDVIDGLEVYQDINKTMSALKAYSILELECKLSSHDWKKFQENEVKARNIYDLSKYAYKEDCSFKTRDDQSVPKWVTKNYKNCRFANDLLEVLITAQYLLHIVPDNADEESTKIFSQPIRQAIYGIMFRRQDVMEIVRVDKKLVKQLVPSIPQELPIETMAQVSEEERVY